MKHTRLSLERNRSLILRAAEGLAVSEGISIGYACQRIVNDPAYFERMLLAMGNWFKGKPPSAEVIRRWYDPLKLNLAKRWPDVSITPEAPGWPPEIETMDQLHHWIAAYLPRADRPKSIKVQERIDQAHELHTKGHSLSDVAAMLEIHLSTIYRWRSASWDHKNLPSKIKG